VELRHIRKPFLVNVGEISNDKRLLGIEVGVIHVVVVNWEAHQWEGQGYEKVEKSTDNEEVTKER
jgi:hypothetical protein